VPEFSQIAKERAGLRDDGARARRVLYISIPYFLVAVK
jgi:hypothetical protein